MFFCLFLLIAMLIMMVIVTTTNENILINVLIIFLSILVLIGGVFFMKKFNFQISAVVSIGLCVLLILEVILFIIYLFSKNNIEIFSSDENISLSKNELENFVLISSDFQQINKKTDVIVVTNNVVLKKSMLSDINSIKKIYFLSSNPAIDSDLYEEIKNRIFFISTENQYLIIEKKDSVQQNNSVIPFDKGMNKN